MIDANLIHYSTLVQDSPSIKNQDGTMGPKNYEGKGTNQWITVEMRFVYLKTPCLPNYY